MSSGESSSPPSGVPIAPVPWVMDNTESWWFITSIIGSGGEDVPSGNFDPLEEQSRKEASGGNFQGGSGLVQIVRYTEGPVGPYDELIIVPGAFKNPVAPPSLRITRIYVSTLASVYNGRKNWNIPKHLAKFAFTPSETTSGGMEIRVYAPTHIDGQQNTTFNEKPFFAALVQPSMLPIPALPLNLKYSPINLVLVQPPLEESDSVEKDGLVGAKRWCSILPNFVGKVKPISVSGLLENNSSEGGASKSPKQIANGIDFPDFSPYRIGIHWPKATLNFPEPKYF